VLCDDISLNRELIDTNVKEDLSNYEIVELPIGAPNSRYSQITISL
jgi:hypothetical protein